MAAPLSADISLDIPAPDVLRERLAIVLTEADLLRAQLRVSIRLQKERDRLRRQRADIPDGAEAVEGAPNG